jgi:RNA polymerase sigma factor (sigma-70 family)
MEPTAVFKSAVMARQDKPAFEQFYCDRRESAYRLACVVLGTREGADDVVQEAFLKVLSRWNRVSQVEDPPAFLKKVVVRCGIDSMRRNARRRETLAKETQTLDQDSLAVRMALDKLRPKDRALLALIVGEGWSYGEASKALGIKEGTVASRLHAAKAAFRKVWDE